MIAREDRRIAPPNPAEGVPSPSAPEGAPGGGQFRSAIAERHVRIFIRVVGVWFGGAMRRSHATKKKHAFLDVFFHVQPKISKWRHFRQYRRFSAMFEQAELQGTQMGPNGPPNAKGTA